MVEPVINVTILDSGYNCRCILCETELHTFSQSTVIFYYRSRCILLHFCRQLTCRRSPRKQRVRTGLRALNLSSSRHRHLPPLFLSNDVFSFSLLSSFKTFALFLFFSGFAFFTFLLRIFSRVAKSRCRNADGATLGRFSNAPKYSRQRAGVIYLETRGERKYWALVLGCRLSAG